MRKEPSAEPLPHAGETDEDLMGRFCQGDAQAFDALFGRYARAVHAYLTRMVGNRSAAEDLTQATFLSLVRARGRFMEGARFRPWLYAIATNAARDHMRRKRPEDLTDEGDLPSSPGEAAPMPDPGLERTIQRALAQLPDAQREAIVLHRFEGMSFGEIAEALGVSESAVKVRAHRGYEKLRELLAHLREEA